MKKDYILYIAPDNKVKNLAREYEHEYNKDTILNKVRGVQKALAKVPELRYAYPDGTISDKPDSVISRYKNKTIASCYKSDLAMMLASFYADRRNELLLSVAWSPDKNELVNMAVRDAVVPEDEIKKFMGPPQESDSRRYWYGYHRTLESMWPDIYPLVEWTEYLRSSSVYLTEPSSEVYAMLPYNTHAAYFGNLYPDVKQPLAENAGLADISSAVTVNFESVIGGAINYLQQSVRSGVLQPGGTMLLKKNAFKLLLEAPLGLKPFEDYKDDFPVELQNFFVTVFGLRFMRAAAALYLTKGKPAVEPLKLLKSMWASLQDIGYAQELDALLPHLSGFKKGDISKFKVYTYVAALISILQDAPAGWLSTDVIKHKVYYAAIQKGMPLLMSYGISNSKIDSSFTDDFITPETVNRDVMYPFVEGMMATMVALGALECVIAPPGGDATSYFSGMKCVRLTNLGRFLLGKLEKYELTVSDSYTHEYDLVDSPLLVYSRKPDNPYDSWLAEIAVKQGRYWVVDVSSFVSRCRNADDVVSRIDMFRKIICKEPGAAWEAFFERIKGNATRGISPYIGEKMALYDIDPYNRDLYELLTSEAVAKLIWRVEGARILVPVSKEAELGKLLRARGFML